MDFCRRVSRDASSLDGFRVVPKDETTEFRSQLMKVRSLWPYSHFNLTMRKSYEEFCTTPSTLCEYRILTLCAGDQGIKSQWFVYVRTEMPKSDDYCLLRGSWFHD